MISRNTALNLIYNVTLAIYNYCIIVIVLKVVDKQNDNFTLKTFLFFLNTNLGRKKVVYQSALSTMKDD